MFNNSSEIIQTPSFGSISNSQVIKEFELSLTLNEKGTYSFYFLIGILVSILGIIGNLLVMISILASKELRTNPTCILCFNIAISDFLMSIFVNGFGKVGK